MCFSMPPKVLVSDGVRYRWSNTWDFSMIWEVRAAERAMHSKRGLRQAHLYNLTKSKEVMIHLVTDRIWLRVRTLFDLLNGAGLLTFCFFCKYLFFWTRRFSSPRVEVHGGKVLSKVALLWHSISEVWRWPEHIGIFSTALLYGSCRLIVIACSTEASGSVFGFSMRDRLGSEKTSRRFHVQPFWTVESYISSRFLNFRMILRYGDFLILFQFGRRRFMAKFSSGGSKEEKIVAFRVNLFWTGKMDEFYARFFSFNRRNCSISLTVHFHFVMEKIFLAGGTHRNLLKSFKLN